MSKIFQAHRRKIIAGGVLIGMTPSRSTHVHFITSQDPNSYCTIGGYALVQTDTLPNPFITPGVKNIEKRYSSGGASPNKTPAVATKRGDSDHVEEKTETKKGIGAPAHEEKVTEMKPPVSRFNPLAQFAGRGVLAWFWNIRKQPQSRYESVSLHVTGKTRRLFLQAVLNR